MPEPKFFMDVNGCILVDKDPGGYVRFDYKGKSNWYHPDTPKRLEALDVPYDLRWSSHSWRGADAKALAKKMDIDVKMTDLDFDVAERPRDENMWSEKLDAIKKVGDDGPIAIMDDRMGPEVEAWAKGKTVLLIQPDKTIGMTEDEFNLLLSFGELHNTKDALVADFVKSSEREIIRPARGSDGLFAQPDDNSPQRETIEAHNRERFANHFHYADPLQGNPRTYDEKGDYNCGRCNMATGEKCLLVKPLTIDKDAGSCGDWENECAGDSEIPLGEKTIATSGYGVAANGKGFGCHRCPYASRAFQADSQGRDLYCGKGDFRVFSLACCVLNGAETLPIDDKGNVKGLVLSGGEWF